MNPVPRPVIQVSGIRKTCGKTVAVEDVSFEVSDGEIFGLIGPNGAGKTNTMECVEGIRRPNSGSNIESLPPALRAVARVLPLSHSASLLQGIWVGDTWSAHVGDIAALTAVFVVCIAVTSRVFRWE